MANIHQCFIVDVSITQEKMVTNLDDLFFL